MTEIPTEAERLREIQAALLDTIRDIGRYLAPPPAPDDEVRSWPLWAAEGPDAGGIWCGDEDCPLEAENSEIGDFRSGTFTLDDLHEAISWHIAARREREEDDG